MFVLAWVIGRIIRGLRRLTGELEDVTAYRIVQEALTNTLKHARAQHADVRIQYLSRAIKLAITDDGTSPGEGSATG